MSEAATQPEVGSTLFQKGIFGLLLISIFGIPLCVTSWIDEGEEKWFLIRTIGPLLAILLVVHQSGKSVKAGENLDYATVISPRHSKVGVQADKVYSRVAPRLMLVKRHTARHIGSVKVCPRPLASMVVERQF